MSLARFFLMVENPRVGSSSLPPGIGFRYFTIALENPRAVETQGLCISFS